MFSLFPQKSCDWACIVSVYIMYVCPCAYALFLWCPGNRLHHYSHVLDPDSHSHFRSLPSCPRLKWALPRPLNSSSSGNIFRPKNPLSAWDGGRDPIDPAAGYYDDLSDNSNNVLVFGGVAVGVAILWFVCCRRRRSSGRRGTTLSKLPVYSMRFITRIILL